MNEPNSGQKYVPPRPNSRKLPMGGEYGEPESQLFKVGLDLYYKNKQIQIFVYTKNIQQIKNTKASLQTTS